MTQTQTCPNCTDSHLIHLQVIRWVVCQNCKHLLKVTPQALIDCGETPIMPDLPSVVKMGDTGRIRGRGFEVIGRIHFRYASDPTDEYWDEWIIRFEDNTYGYLMSEDDVICYFSHRSASTKPIPDFSSIHVDKQISIEGYDAIVSEADTYLIFAFAGQIPDHPLPGSINNYFDASFRNYLVGVEYLENDIMLHYGIEIEPDQFQVD